MIKFFRKIRQQLIKENNMRKYLTYAIGEIILVVIGILIALQINNWNEEAKQSQIEVTFLKRLQNDLQENIKNWDKQIAFQKRRNEGVKAFIRFGLINNKDSFPIIFRHFNTVLRWDDMAFNQVTFKEMQSSGKLDIISNDSIKIKLLQLDLQYQMVFKRNAGIKTGHEKNISDPSFKILNYLDYIALDRAFKKLHPKEYSQKEIREYEDSVTKRFMNLIKNNLFINSLVGSAYSYRLVLGEMEEARSKAKELLTLIEAELK